MAGLNKINTKTLKSSLKVDGHKKICKALGIPIFSESSNQIVYYTGDRNVDAYQGSPKLFFYKDTGVYVGYTSGCTYDIISLTQKRLSLLKQPSSFMDAINFILSVVDLKIDSIQRINKPHICDWESGLGKFIRLRRGESILTPYDDSILDQLETKFYQGWIDEGISIDTMLKYEIKWYERTSQIVIPCRERMGQLIGIRCRNIDPDRAIHAKYMPLTLLDGKDYRFNTNSVFFGINYNWSEIERTGRVILVESEKAVMWLDGLYKEKNIALGMYGKNLGTQRRNQLIKMGVNNIIYVPDNDWIGKEQADFEKWEKEIIQFGNQFKGYANVEVVWDNLGLLKEKENATDGDIDTWNKLLENKETLT